MSQRPSPERVALRLLAEVAAAPDTPDGVLLARYVRENDPAAFRALYDRYAGLVYHLAWAEASRAACHANLDMVANVRRGWNDRKPAVVAPDAEQLGWVARVYGARPSCPDGGSYSLSADGRSCRCGVHGGHDDPRQPDGPTEASPTGRLLGSFAGLTAAVRFEEDGLRVVVTADRRE